MPRTRTKAVLPYLKFLIAATLFGILALNVRHDLNLFSVSAFQPEIPQLVLAQCLFIVYVVICAMIWLYLTRRQGIAVACRSTISIWCFSIVGKYIPGKALLYGIRWYLYRKVDHGIKTVDIVKAFVLEYLSGLATGLILILTILIPMNLSFIPWFGSMAGILTLAVILGSMHPGVLGFLAQLATTRFGFKSSSLDIQYTDLLRMLLLSLLNWLLLGLSIFFIAKAIDPSVTWSLYLYIAASYTLAGMAGFLVAIAPAGLGVREAVLILALDQVMPVQTATYIAITARLVTTAGEAFCITAAWITDWRSETFERVAEAWSEARS
ncbi:MAG: hypothetical protein HOH43_08845 [Candidatus Latescibacteria bacterium]|nr:hypothetical protein [Candidatus Latescibacterota bacterium]